MGIEGADHETGSSVADACWTTCQDCRRIGVILTGVVLGGGWLVLVVVGLVPLVAGSAGACLVAPLFHAPLRGVGRS